ncbi:hypothetical protein Gogos_011843 [Gossypium gossypioides]|uniref:Aminotransferase-like plant mobile domain-containing protein n=1 Tax=Gossypium gossypioides TaxID=34282 RepID=A0A7J9BQR5_GOSGO|nr:hypothetical protein [Gossypium gossypioides]
MVGIRLDNKHISVNQLQMAEDRILQCHIRNLLGPLSSLIETYLRETSFLHVTLVGRGCKLDLKLISALVESGSVQSVQSVDWRTICYDLFGVVSETIYGGQIEMAWLRNNFAELAEDSTQERRERYAWVYIFQIIGGIPMPDKSRNLVHLRWLLKLIDFRGAGKLSWGSTVLATLYQKMCQAPLVVYTTVEMHKADRVLWPFRFQQSILVAPQELYNLHCIDLQQSDTYWLAFHSQYINIWNNRIHGKPYLLGEEAWHRRPHTSRPQRPPLNPMGGEMGPSSVPTQEPSYVRLDCWSSILGVVHTWAISFLDDGDTTTMYRPSMHKAPMESAIVIPSAYETQHSYAH